MDVLKVNKSNFLTSDLIEGYLSMIWTERFRIPGEFEMKTTMIDETKKALPLGSLITLRDSTEVMIVETYSIARDGDGVKVLTISGRSLTSFVEHRNIFRHKPPIAGSKEDTLGARWMDKFRFKQTYTQAGVVSALLWNAFVNGTNTDVIVPNANPIYWNPTTQVMSQHDPKDRILNTVVTDSSTKAGNNKGRFAVPGPIFPHVDKFLRLGDLGFRTIRPSGTSGSVVTVSSTGVISKATVNDIPQLRWDVYNGVDRTKDQTARPILVFRYDAGHLEEPTYLESIKTHKNIVLSASTWSTGLEAPTATYTQEVHNTSGLDRRIGFIDSGVYDPEEMNQAEWAHHTDDESDAYLYARMRRIIFDGKISAYTPHKYKTDYFLGDTVTLQAEYEFTSPMQIIEYVRSESKAGEVGYPTLNLPQPEEL